MPQMCANYTTNFMNLPHICNNRRIFWKNFSRDNLKGKKMLEHQTLQTKWDLLCDNFLSQIWVTFNLVNKFLIENLKQEKSKGLAWCELPNKSMLKAFSRSEMSQCTACNSMILLVDPLWEELSSTYGNPLRKKFEIKQVSFGIWF